MHAATVKVPKKTNEAGMRTLLVIGFNADGRKRWRVVARNLSERVMEEVGLWEGWRYELEQQQAATTPWSRYDGQRWDIELDTAWAQTKVHEVVRKQGCEELKKKNKPGATEETAGPLTRLETRDEQDRPVGFAVRESWTYVLEDVDWRAQNW
jgi:hypothetical protein